MEQRIGPVWMGGCIILALLVALLSTGALKLLATPSNYRERLGAVERKVLRAERLAALPGDSVAYPKGAVCEGLSERAVNQARGAFEQAAATEGLGAVQMVWGAPVDAAAKIASVPLSLRAEGPYEKVAGFMDRLGRGAPALFVDTADIVPSGAGVQLTLSGKVFCWTRG